MFIFQKFGIIGVNEFTSKADLFKYLSALSKTQHASFFLSAFVSREFARNEINPNRNSPLIDLDRKLSEKENKWVDSICGLLKKDENLAEITKGKPLGEKGYLMLARATFEVYQKFQGAGLRNEEKNLCLIDGFCLSTMAVQDISEELLSKFISIREKRRETFNEALNGAKGVDIAGMVKSLYSAISKMVDSAGAVQAAAKGKAYSLMFSAIQYYLGHLQVEKDHERSEFVQGAEDKFGEA